jgi:hypothetical protein
MAPPTAPTPAPTAVFWPCADMPEHPLSRAIINSGKKIYLLGFMMTPFKSQNMFGFAG